MKQHFKFEHVNEITGVFVLLVVLVLIGAIVWMAYSQSWFRRTAPLEIVLPPEGAAGIQEGSDVYFLGTYVGKVTDVLVTPDGRMIAETRVRSDFFRFLRAGSFAGVKRKLGLAGDAYFDITRGTGPPLPWRGASIPCKSLPPTIETAIDEIRRAVLPVLEKVNAGVETWTALGRKLSTGAEAWTVLGAHLDESRTRLDQLFARLDTLVAGVEQGQGTAGKLLTDPTVANDVKSVLDKGNASMDQVQGILKDAQSASAHLATLSETLAREAKELPGLVAQAQQTLYELERLIQGIERVWPIRSHVEQRPSDTRISPSEVVP
jgi:phospholipid/cholesterol/gamma-HCH transport system substrate-binding protein